MLNKTIIKRQLQNDRKLQRKDMKQLQRHAKLPYMRMYGGWGLLHVCAQGPVVSKSVHVHESLTLFIKQSKLYVCLELIKIMVMYEPFYLPPWLLPAGMSAMWMYDRLNSVKATIQAATSRHGQDRKVRGQEPQNTFLCVRECVCVSLCVRGERCILHTRSFFAGRSSLSGLGQD